MNLKTICSVCDGKAFEQLRAAGKLINIEETFDCETHMGPGKEHADVEEEDWKEIFGDVGRRTAQPGHLKRPSFVGASPTIATSFVNYTGKDVIMNG